MRDGKRLYPTLIGGLLTAGLVLIPSFAGAQSACRGLEQSLCVDTDGCGWTRGYTRSDGREVAGYCRTRNTGNRQAREQREAMPDEGRVVQQR
ncbi:hypothetical protein ABC977_09540 [Thioalkalicoccus limnaeus]|uniref:Uncharacterized protein n=1 Tax=Thioalkalicoccus limnaeus TaxID=120681 RepID=A0ABV4BDQ9_9GAMM